MILSELRHQDKTIYRFPRIKQRCSITDIAESVFRPATSFEGRDMDCEIHIDGDLLFCAFGALGAALAYLIYQAITQKSRRRRKRESDPISYNLQFLASHIYELALLGTYLFSME